jgi:glucokinase
MLLGVDLGGTYTKMALVDARGRIRARAKFETHVGLGVDRWVSALAAEARALGEFDAAGVAVPGLLDRAKGAVIRSPNLRAWDGYPLLSSLRRTLRRKVVLENDANAAALAESRHGAGRRWPDFILVTVGTGIGGGVILGGELFVGPGGMAGEMGHLLAEGLGPAEAPGRACGCGNRGCVETVASITGLLASAREGARKVGIAPPESGEELAAWLRGSKATKRRIARSAFDRGGRALGLAFAQATTLLDVRRFLVAGGGAASLQALAPGIRAAVASHIYGRPPSSIEIRRASLGDDAGALGAAALAGR